MFGRGCSALLQTVGWTDAEKLVPGIDPAEARGVPINPKYPTSPIFPLSILSSTSLLIILIAGGR